MIAWDGTTLAGDKRTSFGGLHATTTKVHRLPDGRLFAGCGPTALIQEMRHWIAAGADPATFPAAQRVPADCVSALVVQINGSLLQYETTAYPLVLENRQWAIGSGRDFAVMAMRLGKTAAEAVLLTAEFCHDCGNGADALDLNERA
jgi:hypothetical protein